MMSNDRAPVGARKDMEYRQILDKRALANRAATVGVPSDCAGLTVFLRTIHDESIRAHQLFLLASNRTALGGLPTNIPARGRLIDKRETILCEAQNQVELSQPSLVRK